MRPLATKWLSFTAYSLYTYRSPAVSSIRLARYDTAFSADASYSGSAACAAAAPAHAQTVSNQVTNHAVKRRLFFIRKPPVPLPPTAALCKRHRAGLCAAAAAAQRVFFSSSYA